MAQNDLIIMALAVLVVGAILYRQINKISQNITFEDENPNLTYAKFCDAIDLQIDMLRKKALENEIIQPYKKDDILESLSDFSKELVFIESLNSKDNAQWQSKLFALLSRIDEFTKNHFNDGEMLAEHIKENLRVEFNRLGLDRN